MELQGGMTEDQEDGTVKIRFDTFNGATWSQVMDFAETIVKCETDMKRQKTEGASFAGSIAVNACE